MSINRKLAFTIAAAPIVLAGCISVPPPAPAPQVRIQGMESDAARARIVQRCVERGGNISENDAYQIVCAVPMDGSFGSMMFRAMATPRFASNPDAKTRYTLSQNNGELFISMHMYLEYQNAYGQYTRTPVNNPQLREAAQAFLEEIKAGHEAAVPATPAPLPTEG